MVSLHTAAAFPRRKLLSEHISHTGANESPRVRISEYISCDCAARARQSRTAESDLPTERTVQTRMAMFRLYLAPLISHRDPSSPQLTATFWKT